MITILGTEWKQFTQFMEDRNILAITSEGDLEVNGVEPMLEVLRPMIVKDDDVVTLKGGSFFLDGGKRKKVLSLLDGFKSWREGVGRFNEVFKSWPKV